MLTAVVALAGGITIHGQAPAPGAKSRAIRVPYTEFTLPNGLHVILHRDASVPVVYDPAHDLAGRFPAIGCPATFVIDPDGRLIAILDDHGWPEFLDELMRQTDRAPAHGAIDQQDIRR